MTPVKQDRLSRPEPGIEDLSCRRYHGDDPFLFLSPATVRRRREWRKAISADLRQGLSRKGRCPVETPIG